MENYNEIVGYFTHIIYQTDSYMVASFLSDDEKITVTGPFFSSEKHTKYVLTGEYIDHPKYGFQFNFIKADKYLPNNKDEIVNFLSSSLFASIGKKTATKIFDFFKEDTLNILKENPDRIYDMSLSSKQYEGIITGFNSLTNIKADTIWDLMSKGFSNNEAEAIYLRYKEETLNVFYDNPYRFYLDIFSLSYHKICEIASKMDVENKLVKFQIATLVWMFNDITFAYGHTYLDYDDFCEQYNRYFNDDSLNNIISLAVDMNYIYVEENRYYLYQEYQNELYISEYIKNLKEYQVINDNDLDLIINDINNNPEITYDDEQVDSLKTFFKNPFMIITGGPGTGKTTIVKKLVSMYKEYLPFNNIVVVAPTGRAAKRINEICDVESKTIHSLLKWDKETNTFNYGVDNPIMYDALIIDEFSMVDNFLFASLLKASSRIKQICIIGDDHQLPSIRQGNVLKDIISLNIFPLIKLTNNHRQKEGSEIVKLALDVINNSVKLDRYNDDILFIENNNIEDLLTLLNNEGLNENDLDDIQVLAPMYKGVLGIDNLNINLQKYFNPKSDSKNEKIINQTIYREYDRVIQLKNRPLDDVYNGDIGIIEEINNDEHSVLVNFSGTYVYYSFDELQQELSLAYAISVHKAQGSEYKKVYFVVPSASKGMLNKKLIYTALTRARNKLVIYGSLNSFISGCNIDSRIRKTSLTKRFMLK